MQTFPFQPNHAGTFFAINVVVVVVEMITKNKENR